MPKTKLAICFGDKEYQRRFVKCFMHHFESRYEVHVFAGISELKQSDYLYIHISNIGIYP